MKNTALLPLLLAISEAKNWEGPTVSYGGKTLEVSDVDMRWMEISQNE